MLGGMSMLRSVRLDAVGGHRGYLLVPSEQIARDSNTRRQSFGVYFGVDRPFLPPVTERQFEDLVEGKDMTGTWFDLVDRIEEAHQPGTAFISDVTTTRRLRDLLEGVGGSTEILSVFQVVRPGSNAVGCRLEELIREFSETVDIYGYDVSCDHCNHSAIVQPGVVDQDPTWKLKLNEFGLMDNCEDALRLRELYASVYSSRDFEVFLVARAE